MNSLLARMIPLQNSAEMFATETARHPSNKTLNDFVSFMKQAGARLSRFRSEEKDVSSNTRGGSPTTTNKPSPEKRKNSEGSSLKVGDLTPVFVLLQESSIPSEKIGAFINSLTSVKADAGCSPKELPSRVRDMVVSEKGGDGRVLLEPASRLRLESALTEWGLSPKEADRVIALSSTGEGTLDVEKFARLTVLHRVSSSESMAEQGKGKQKSREEGRVDDPRADGSLSRKGAAFETSKTGGAFQTASSEQSPGAPLAGGKSEHQSAMVVRPFHPARGASMLVFKAAEKDGTMDPHDGGFPIGALSQGAKQATARQNLQAHTGHKDPTTSKPEALSVQTAAQNQRQKEAGFDRSKTSDGSDTSSRSWKEVASEESSRPGHAGPFEGSSMPHQSWTKSAQTSLQPSPMVENPAPPQVAAQVSRQISRALLNGDRKILLRLNPPELGTLKVHLEWKGESLRIEMVTDRSHAKELLLASASELRDALGEHGYRVDRMDVQVNDSFGQGLFQSGGEHREAVREAFPVQEKSSGFPDDETEEENSVISFTGRQDHLIDLVA